MIMKTLSISLTIALFVCYLPSDAQVLKNLGKKAQKAAERTVERRVERETSKKTDEALDKVFEPGKNTKETDKEAGNSGDVRQDETVDAAGVKASKEFVAYGKFDFIPGERIIAVEDFSQDAIGDFPANWNTNASGEVKTIEGIDGRWLALTTKGAIIPDFITSLPDNFTLEFDLAVTPGYSFYDQPLMVSMASVSGANNFTAWSRFGKGKQTGVLVTLHPQDAGNVARGHSSYELWSNGKKTMDNKVGGLETFNANDRNHVRVSIWRQNQRLRFYIDESKVWDLPRAFENGTSYNSVIFSRDGAKDGNHFLIGNIRLAVGEPDTRNKLISEGKFSTTGIYFNTGSAVIKPESYGVLKEIAGVLQENPDVSVNIVGHTDSDGSAALNLKLSKDRAESVKAVLNKEFNIATNRMETGGKGASEPVGDNKTAEGKSQNRRVEFIRL